MDRPLSSGEELSDDILLPPINHELSKNDIKEQNLADSEANRGANIPRFPYELMRSITTDSESQLGAKSDAQEKAIKLPDAGLIIMREDIHKAIENNTPIEAELERSHEIKHFDVPSEPPPITPTSVGAILQNRQPIVASVHDVSSPKSQNLEPPSHDPSKPWFPGLYRQAIIGGFITGVAVAFVLLLIDIIG